MNMNNMISEPIVNVYQKKREKKIRNTSDLLQAHNL
jgi:hypothetical protein